MESYTRDEAKNALSETAANIVENIAYRVAERQGGRIAANHLAPYLPMSLELIASCLRDMADGYSVAVNEAGPFPIFEFTDCLGKGCNPDELHFTSCPACGKDISKKSDYMLCPECFQALEKELNRLAEAIGWPAKAVYEHEILYLAAKQRGPQHASQLAAHSRFTLKRMKQKLKAMTLTHFVRQELDDQAGAIVYHFPEIDYSRKSFQRNMAMIRRYPSSMTEDVELKIVRITLSLAALLAACFILAFLRIPIAVLAVGFAVIAPLLTLKIWRHRDKPPEV